MTTPVPSAGVVVARGAAGEAPCCAVDRNGQKYTTAVAGVRGDWWYGEAIILLPDVIARLKRDGLLPLTEVTP